METFRDKITPGDREEWKIKISGSKGEKEAAEMLASMYDASLDVFAANYWNFNIYPNYYYSQRFWNTGNSFSIINSMLHEENWNQYIPAPSMPYDHLNYFGFNLFSYGYVNESGVYYKSMANSASIRSLAPQAEYLAADVDKDEKKQDLSLEDAAGGKEKNPEAEFKSIPREKI